MLALLLVSQATHHNSKHTLTSFASTTCTVARTHYIVSHVMSATIVLFSLGNHHAGSPRHQQSCNVSDHHAMLPWQSACQELETSTVCYISNQRAILPWQSACREPKTSTVLLHQQTTELTFLAINMPGSPSTEPSSAILIG